MVDESKYPTRIAPYGLRIPPDLKVRIQTAADANSRTMHSEILAALEEKFPAQPQLSNVESSLVLLKFALLRDNPDRAKTLMALRELEEDLKDLKKHIYRGLKAED
ncbi:Arc family DNA-binding protein [Pseudogemmobacter sonorensis]|uniref:Arc family DNA-binding protein n=1 Tax=Pseudogemmobacter sonorensis TaxID=2989681 RepID=UPI003F681E3C